MVRGSSRARLWKWLRSYWGVIVLIVLFVNLDGELGVAPYVVLSALMIIWTLFSAPTRCGALNRKRGQHVEYCRNNANGLMLGCSIRQHTYQRFTTTWWSESWRDRWRGTWNSAPARLSTVAGLGGLILGLIGLGFSIVDHL